MACGKDAPLTLTLSPLGRGKEGVYKGRGKEDADEGEERKETPLTLTLSHKGRGKKEEVSKGKENKRKKKGEDKREEKKGNYVLYCGIFLVI